MPVAEGLDGFTQIAQQVPSIGNLDGGGSTLANAVGVSARAITGDDLDARPIS